MLYYPFLKGSTRKGTKPLGSVTFVYKSRGSSRNAVKLGVTPGDCLAAFAAVYLTEVPERKVEKKKETHVHNIHYSRDNLSTSKATHGKNYARNISVTLAESPLVANV